jgi:pimeloyl-ACP methyl ester carboxylesterase
MIGDRLNDGLSVVAVGEGPALVTLPGLGRGADLSIRVPPMTAFATGALARGLRRRVHLIHRPVTVAPGMTVADLAGWYAKALRERFDGPVDVMGTSAGGITALQLAMDHPDVVRRLIVCIAASRPDEQGKKALLRLVTAERRGRPRPWGASGLIAHGPLRLATYATFLLGGKGIRAQGEAALVAAAQDWDVTDRLGEISAPTLVIAGTRDALIPAEAARATAAGVPDGRLLLINGGDHLSTMFDRRVSPAIRQFLAA